MLPPELLAEFVRLGTTRSFPKGTIVVTEGEPAEVLYVVQEGQLRVYAGGDGDSDREVELNVLGPGEYLGELLLDGHVRSASARTLTPARLTMIRRDDFQRILGDRPDIAFQLIQSLIHKVRLLSRNVQGLVAMDVYGRIARLFGELSEPDGEGRRVIRGKLSQQKIADRVGASRSMVNRILKDLSDGGYITIAADEMVLQRELPRRW